MRTNGIQHGVESKLCEGIDVIKGMESAEKVFLRYRGRNPVYVIDVRVLYAHVVVDNRHHRASVEPQKMLSFVYSQI